MSATFTAAMLEEAKACQLQIDLFRATFGESVAVTVARARKVSDQFDWGCATRFLDAVGVSEYKRVRDLAWAEYDRVLATALAECDRVRASGWAEYDRVLATAQAECDRVRASGWASAYIATHKRAAVDLRAALKATGV